MVINNCRAFSNRLEKKSLWRLIFMSSHIDWFNNYNIQSSMLFLTIFT